MDRVVFIVLKFLKFDNGIFENIVWIILSFDIFKLGLVFFINVSIV